MKKNITPYLPYYIGQEIATEDEQYNSPGLKLIGISDMGCQVRDEGIGLTFYVSPDTCKLRLRPLADMTEEEAEEFAFLCMNPVPGTHPEFIPISKDEIQIELVPNDGGNMLDGDVAVYIGISCRCWDGNVCIMTDGRIGINEEDQESEKMKPVDGVAFKIDYLLKQGFDLFGLIPDGLAIDKTQNQ